MSSSVSQTSVHSRARPAAAAASAAPAAAYGWELPCVSPQLSLAGGVLQFAQPARMTEVVEPGIKLVLVLVLGGQLHYQLRDPAAAALALAGVLALPRHALTRGLLTVLRAGTGAVNDAPPAAAAAD